MRNENELATEFCVVNAWEENKQVEQDLGTNEGCDGERLVVCILEAFGFRCSCNFPQTEPDKTVGSDKPDGEAEMGEY